MARIDINSDNSTDNSDNNTFNNRTPFFFLWGISSFSRRISIINMNFKKVVPKLL